MSIDQKMMCPIQFQSFQIVLHHCQESVSKTEELVFLVRTKWFRVIRKKLYTSCTINLHHLWGRGGGGSMDIFQINELCFSVHTCTFSRALPGLMCHTTYLTKSRCFVDGWINTVELPCK
jgi:hypothetical protein